MIQRHLLMAATGHDVEGAAMAKGRRCPKFSGLVTRPARPPGLHCPLSSFYSKRQHSTHSPCAHSLGMPVQSPLCFAGSNAIDRPPRSTQIDSSDGPSVSTNRLELPVSPLLSFTRAFFYNQWSLPISNQPWGELNKSLQTSFSSFQPHILL